MKARRNYFNTKELSKQNGYTIIDDSLFKYQDLLGLDFIDLGIICRLFSFSPKFIINLSSVFKDMGKTQRYNRIKKLKDKKYILTKKSNYKTKEGIRSGGLEIDLKPLVNILDFLAKADKEGWDLESALNQAKIENLDLF